MGHGSSAPTNTVVNNGTTLTGHMCGDSVTTYNNVGLMNLATNTIDNGVTITTNSGCLMNLGSVISFNKPTAWDTTVFNHHPAPPIKFKQNLVILI